MRGDAARSNLDNRIASYERDIDAVLASYHPVSAVQSWRAETRASVTAPTATPTPSMPKPPMVPTSSACSMGVT